MGKESLRELPYRTDCLKLLSEEVGATYSFIGKGNGELRIETNKGAIHWEESRFIFATDSYSYLSREVDPHLDVKDQLKPIMEVLENIKSDIMVESYIRRGKDQIGPERLQGHQYWNTLQTVDLVPFYLLKQ